MSNIRNMNQVNPFWDFIASLQDPSNQAMFAQQHRGPPDHEENEDADAFDGHWAGAWGPFGGPPGGRGFGSRSGHGHGPRGGRRGPPPPPEHEGFEHDHESHDRRSRRGPPHGPPPPHHEGGPRGPPPPHGPPLPHQGRGPSPPPPPPPPFAEDPPSRSPTPPPPPPPGFEAPESHHAGHHGPPPHHRRGGRCGGRGGHGHGPHGHGAHGHGPRRGGPRGPFGGPRHGGPGFMGGAPFDLSALAEAFAPGLFAGNNNNNNNNGNSAASRNGPAEDGTFSLEVDVFDTPAAYIIHGSLPGAKKSDLSITYSAQRSSVCISGVVTRPDVDEELMATLALDERKVGSFEREIKLERGVQIEEDRIGAKLEDGVLRVTVPKVQLLEDSEEEYVDVKKVELE